jgi:hypothetical protein
MAGDVDHGRAAIKRGAISNRSKSRDDTARSLSQHELRGHCSKLVHSLRQRGTYLFRVFALASAKNEKHKKKKERSAEGRMPTAQVVSQRDVMA